SYGRSSSGSSEKKLIVFVPIVKLQEEHSEASQGTARRHSPSREQRRSMENSFKVLLVVTLAAMVHGRPVAQTFLEDHPLQFIAEAVDFYNGESHSDVVFALYKDEYEYKVGPKGQKQVNFTIKETVCLKSENRTIGNCEFKLYGLEKKCIALKNNQEKRYSVVCSTISPETKKDPGSGFMEKPGSQAYDYTDQPEDEVYYEDHVIIMDDNEKIFLEEDGEDKKIIDELLASKTEDTHGERPAPEPTRRRTQPGQFLGRFLCFECFFELLPKK
ncbi:cathelicidin-related antimicrobial peptide Bf-CRAMP-like, partial [Hyla sarda]|uniref:cathelicidin-related antimicrobial peptide Bf-CRAMP-like n=1 Tax=Hyla sarda TaxID=327740 RepID=UPI0024C3B448